MIVQFQIKKSKVFKAMQLMCKHEVNLLNITEELASFEGKYMDVENFFDECTELNYIGKIDEGVPIEDTVWDGFLLELLAKWHDHYRIRWEKATQYTLEDHDNTDEDFIKLAKHHNVTHRSTYEGTDMLGKQEDIEKVLKVMPNSSPSDLKEV